MFTPPHKTAFRTRDEAEGTDWKCLNHVRRPRCFRVPTGRDRLLWEWSTRLAPCCSRDSFVKLLYVRTSVSEMAWAQQYLRDAESASAICSPVSLHSASGGLITRLCARSSFVPRASVRYCTNAISAVGVESHSPSQNLHLPPTRHKFGSLQASAG